MRLLPHGLQVSQHHIRHLQLGPQFGLQASQHRIRRHIQPILDGTLLNQLVIQLQLRIPLLGLHHIQRLRLGLPFGLQLIIQVDQRHIRLLPLGLQVSQHHIRLQPLIPQLGQRVKVQVNQPHVRHLLSGILVSQHRTRLQLLIQRTGTLLSRPQLLGIHFGPLILVQAEQRHVQPRLNLIRHRELVIRLQPLGRLRLRLHSQLVNQRRTRPLLRLQPRTQHRT
jgi:hypothetical protein